MDTLIEAGGSSPLARGTPVKAGRWAFERRFIPAGAGNTTPAPTVRRSIPVHPRWRGEHGVAELEFTPGGGSSPLARGTLDVGLGQLVESRFIPAGAGNTYAGYARN